MEQIAAMVDQLAERMKQQPDDAKGWTMLARSYTVLGRFSDALPAYRRAIELVPNNANLLADYADAIAATKGSANNPESESLVERALRLEPNHIKALALAGTAAYDRGDFAGAIAHWQKIVDQLPAESELAQKVQASIAEAREHAGGATALAQARRRRRRATASQGSAAADGQGQRHGHAGAGAARTGGARRHRVRVRPPAPAAACRSRCAAPRSPTCR